MAKRGGPGKPLLPDFHLWEDVTLTLRPLRSRRVRPKLGQPKIGRPSTATATAPPPDQLRPKPVKIVAMPSYQSPGTPGKPPVGGIEPKLRQKLGRGRVPIDGTLDLHGMRQDQARAALVRYLTARAARGDRTILVITGKGLKKLNGDPTTIIERGVLRTMLPTWLNSAELSPMVAGWDQSAQHHGGEGAWYVRLRRVAP